MAFLHPIPLWFHLFLLSFSIIFFRSLRLWPNVVSQACWSQHSISRGRKITVSRVAWATQRDAFSKQQNLWGLSVSLYVLSALVSTALCFKQVGQSHRQTLPRTGVWMASCKLIKATFPHMTFSIWSCLLWPALDINITNGDKAFTSEY